MKESISIRNFGGLKDVTIPLNSINIFIGKQASGKSITAKLIYFFRKVFEDIFSGLYEDNTEAEIKEKITNRFKTYFPADSWSNRKFLISYQADDERFTDATGVQQQMSFGSISIEKKSKTNIKIECSKLFQELSIVKSFILDSLKEERGKNLVERFSRSSKNAARTVYSILGRDTKPLGFQIFVPAGRSFFSNIQSSIFSILASGNSIDPFIVEFGSIYETIKNDRFDSKDISYSIESQKYLQNSLKEITGAEFFTDKTGDYLIHKDGRKINLLFCSSGQQEVLPLALVLKNFFAVLNALNLTNNTIYIEEPEAHLFPSAQKKIVEMVAVTHNIAKGNSQLVITTHSPYILTSFNNLLQAGQLLEKGASKRKLFKIVPEFEILKPGQLNAYAFANGGVTNLIDEETGLISADLLDEVSEEIAVQFDELLDL